MSHANDDPRGSASKAVSPDGRHLSASAQRRPSAMRHQAPRSLRIVQPLAMSARSDVYLVELRRGGYVGRYALKHLSTGRCAASSSRAMPDEARVWWLLDHPNVCRLSNAWRDRNGVFLLLEYVPGLSLSQLAARSARRPADLRMLVGLFLGVCRGLHYVHELRGDGGAHLHLVHGNVTPSNVMASSDGTARVLDFSLADAAGSRRVEGPAGFRGDLAYMAPERLRGQSSDRRADVFAAGAVLHELICGAPLFRRATAAQTLAAILRRDTPRIEAYRPDAPPALGDALAGALARDPNRRLPTMEHLGAALTRAVAPLGGPASGDEISWALASRLGKLARALHCGRRRRRG